jgi:predicted dehydrogenase
METTMVVEIPVCPPNFDRAVAHAAGGPIQLRAGIVGLGKQALADHVPGLLTCRGAVLAAVCDIDPGVVENSSKRLSVPGYTRPAALLDEEELDLVIVCVPHHAGGAVIEAAAMRGVHVLKEKPFATSMAEARRLAEVCEGSGIHLMVTLQRRFNPIYASFIQFADQIGIPFIVDARYTMHIPDPSGGWRGHNERAGGGCIIDMGYHLIDMILWYFGLPDRIWADTSARARPDRVYDAEDTAMIHFGYDEGLYGSLLLSRFMGPKSEQLQLTGSEGIVELERGTLRRLANDGQVIESLCRQLPGLSSAACQIEHFCRIINGLRPNNSSPLDNLSHMSFIEACYLSARTHTSVNPKEIR